MKQFAHLHVHTEFSLLDGAVRIDKVFELCDKLNIPAIAITDHGNMYGVIKFLQAAVRHTDFRADFLDFMTERRPFKVKPIIGCEVCMTDNMHLHEKGKDNVPPKFYHLVLLAKNEAGYNNLMKIVSEGYAEGTYDNPHVDFEFIKAHSEGLIALSACLAGVIPQAILENDFALADAWIKKFKDVFGDDFYVEIQNHDMNKQKIVLPHLIRLAKENSVKVVATNDAHYSTKVDSETQKVLLAISDCSVSGNADVDVDVSDSNFFLTDEFYIKNYDEMYAALPYEDALAASLEIAEKCDPYLIKKEQLLSSYIPPEGMTAEQFLSKLTFDELKMRYGEANVSKIATFERFSASIAIRCVGRVYNYPDSEIEKITRLIPTTMMPRKNQLEYILKSDEWEDEIWKSDFNKLKEMYKNDEKVRVILDMAMKIEGMPQKIGVHSAGF